jgi:hypothetical protein
METPDITPVQGGSAAGFAAIIIAALNADLTEIALGIVCGSAALVACAAIISDAIIRKGRAGALAAEMQGLEGNVALTGHYSNSPAEAAD